MTDSIRPEPVAHHAWLGVVRRCGDGWLIATIEVDPAIRAARQNGETDAEVLISAAPALSAAALDALLDMATARVRTALAELDGIKAYVVAHAPSAPHHAYPEVAATPLAERLFLEGFTVSSPAELEICFDFGDLDMLAVRVDAAGHCHDVHTVR